jgi:hypothetical protein
MSNKRELYIVEILRTPDTGVPIIETWRRTSKRLLLGPLHRIDGPARIRRDSVTGDILQEEWRVNGCRSPAKPSDSRTGQGHRAAPT